MTTDSGNSTPTISKVVGAYRKLRDEKSALAAEFKKDASVIHAKMLKLESWLLNQLNETDAESVRTEHGTVFKSTRVSSKVEDWPVTLAFIKDNELWHLLDKRVAKAAVQEYEEEHSQAFPGVSLSREIVINVRK